MMIGYKQMENSIFSCFETMAYIFLKLVIKSLELHYSVLFHRVTDLNQHHLIYQKYRNHFPHDQKPMSTFQPKRTTII